MFAKTAKVTGAPLPYGEALACLGYCVLNNRECSDSEFFTANLKMARKIQNLNFFAGAIERAQIEWLMMDFALRVPGNETIQNLNVSSVSLLQGKNSESEFYCETEPAGGANAPVSYPEYRTLVRTKMRELKM